jgi:hypothetical protein
MESPRFPLVKIEDSPFSNASMLTVKRTLPVDENENHRLDSTILPSKESHRTRRSSKRGKTSAFDSETSARESLKAVPQASQTWITDGAFRFSCVSSIQGSPMVPQNALLPDEHMSSSIVAGYSASLTELGTSHAANGTQSLLLSPPERSETELLEELGDLRSQLEKQKTTIAGLVFESKSSLATNKRNGIIIQHCAPPRSESRPWWPNPILGHHLFH